jgi:hypothetical protein
LKAINGSPLTVYGEFYAQIRIDLIVFEFPVIVVDQSEELVIGNDFRTKFNAVINYAKKKIQLERRDSRFINVPRIIPFHSSSIWMKHWLSHRNVASSIACLSRQFKDRSVA